MNYDYEFIGRAALREEGDYFLIKATDNNTIIFYILRIVGAIVKIHQEAEG